MQRLAEQDGGERLHVQAVPLRLQDVAQDRAELDEAYQQACPFVNAVVRSGSYAHHADHADEREVGHHLAHRAAHRLREADVLAQYHGLADAKAEVAHDDSACHDEPRYHVRQALLYEGGRKGGEPARHALRNGFFDGFINHHFFPL